MSDFLSGRSQGGLAGGLPSGVKLAAIALLVHQLMKHSRSGGASAPAQEAGAGGGGLGGLLGGLFGGGAEQAPARPAQAPGPWGHQTGGAMGGQPAAGEGPGLWDMLRGGAGGGVLGGLGGLLGGLRSQGLSQHVDSWVSHGPNQPVAPEELERGFDPHELDEAARRAGTDRNTLLRELSTMLPQAVDRLTPQGRLPQREEDMDQGGLGGLLGSLLGQGGPHRR